MFSYRVPMTAGGPTRIVVKELLFSCDGFDMKHYPTIPIKKWIESEVMKDQIALLGDIGRLVALCVRRIQSFLLDRYSRSIYNGV